MAGNKDANKFDNESCSTASFEDVGGAAAGLGDRPAPEMTKNVVVAFGTGYGPTVVVVEDEPVPDVLYVVQYADPDGKIVETRKSDKPIDVSEEKNVDDTKTNKPVIEILTKVSASVVKGGHGHGQRRRANKRVPLPRVRYSDDYYSATSESEDDGGNNGSMSIEKVHKTEMIIHSEHLRNALSAVVSYYPGFELIGESVSIAAPYNVLIHHRDALSRYRSAQPACHDAGRAAETARHIDVLLGFLDATYGARIGEEEARHRRDPPAVTFDWFWLLFKPGEVLYRKGSHNRWVPYVISGAGYTYSSASDDRASFAVDCWSLRYGTGRVRRNMKKLTTRFFEGEQAIRNLPIIPAAFFPADYLEGGEGFPSMAAKQIALGRAYWELVKRPAYKEYEGELINREGDNGLEGLLNGRVIVDAEGFDRFRYQGPNTRRGGLPHPPPPHHTRHMAPPPPKDQLPYFGPRCSCTVCELKKARDASVIEPGPLANFEDLNPSKDEPPQNDLYFLAMAKDIPGFVLAERRWGHLAVEHLKEVKPDREAFKHLVLDDEVKMTVKSLIGKFASADGKVTPWPRDLIKNKGEGRIFLLHGSPGVGKTATCEAAAELGQRPLLCLTSGDISTSMHSAEVENNLNYFLQLGERYGALVLLDEADVYLEQRRTKDLQRNGLVSIFLRALEYYKGVLFLTTNRVEAFDSAFTSRIHVALHYRRLTDEDRRRVWDNHFDRLERDTGSRFYVGMTTREFVHASPEIRVLRLNGRQIKNALQVAVALAESEAAEDVGGVDSPEEAAALRVTVTERHIRAVVKMNKGFKDFMRRRRGWSEDSDEHDADHETDSGKEDDSDLE